MQSQCQGLRRARLERNVLAGHRDPFGVCPAIRRELLIDKTGEIGALPAALGKQRVRA